jgi:uncharacterized integral membrane protein
MRTISFIFLLCLIVILGFLTYENNRPTTLTAWQWNWELPLPVVVLVVYVLGMLTGGALVSAVKRSWHRVAVVER